MKNKGFTLVELLAVIVILAIILLIAVPNILNVIEKAKEKADDASVELVKKGANYEYLQESMFGNYEAKTDATCDKVAKIDMNVYNCTYTTDNSGNATVTLSRK